MAGARASYPARVPPGRCSKKKSARFDGRGTRTLGGFLPCDSHTAARLRARKGLRRVPPPQPGVGACEGSGHNAPSFPPPPLSSRRAKIRFPSGARARAVSPETPAQPNRSAKSSPAYQIPAKVENARSIIAPNLKLRPNEYHPEVRLQGFQ
jgi:hypothetical protein